MVKSKREENTVKAGYWSGKTARKPMGRKRASDYCNEIMEAVRIGMLPHNVQNLGKWQERYGKDCLSEVVTKIVKRAMRNKK